MEKIELTMEEYGELMLGDEIGSGSYGKIIEYDENTLLKMYYGIYMEISYSNMNDKDLQDISNKEIDEIKRKKKLLDKTNMSDLFRGIVTYDDKLIGLILTYYKDYVCLDELKDKLSSEQMIKVLNNVKKTLYDLMNNGCYAMDIKYKNILVREYDLDVKIIDLDDVLTQYYENLSFDDEFKIRNNCLKYFCKLR